MSCQGAPWALIVTRAVQCSACSRGIASGESDGSGLIDGHWEMLWHSDAVRGVFRD